MLFKRGLRLFKGLCLLFLPNVPGAMFIQWGTFIPDSRVPLLTFVDISTTTYLPPLVNVVCERPLRKFHSKTSKYFKIKCGHKF